MRLRHKRSALPPIYGIISAWVWEDNEQALDRPLWLLVRLTGELLASEELDRVRECPSIDGCGWLFVDIIKNGNRR